MKYDEPYQNLYETLVASAKRFPNKCAIRDEDGYIEYGALVERVDAIAVMLAFRCGRRKGDRIALLMVNSIDCVASFYAIVKLGCVAVTINTKLQEPQISHILRDSGCQTIILNDLWRDKVEPYAKQNHLQYCIYDHSVHPEEMTLEQAYDVLEKKRSDTVCEPELPAVIMYTSGSSGMPKSAVILHENILQTAYGYVDNEGLTSDAITVLSVPMFHILGLSCVTTMFMYLGGTLILEKYFNSERTLRDITHYHATHFHSAPTVYIKLMEAWHDCYDLSSLRVAVCGGAIIAQKDIDAFCRLAPNARFLIAYGMTETAGGGMMSREHRGDPAPLRNCDAMIVNDDFCPLGVGQQGEILMGGPMVIHGYDKGQHQDSFHDGWIRTGDLGVWTDKGCVRIEGRIKEIINRGGEKVSPTMVERALNEHPKVQQSVVVALPDPVYGEVGGALVVVKSNETPTAAELKDFLIRRLSKAEIPEVFVFEKEAPCTATGKVDRKLIAKRLADMRRADGDKGGNLQ